jgi:hypothetical protein
MRRTNRLSQTSLPMDTDFINISEIFVESFEINESELESKSSLFLSNKFPNTRVFTSAVLPLHSRFGETNEFPMSLFNGSELFSLISEIHSSESFSFTSRIQSSRKISITSRFKDSQAFLLTLMFNDSETFSFTHGFHSSFRLSMSPRNTISRRFLSSNKYRDSLEFVNSDYKYFENTSTLSASEMLEDMKVKVSKPPIFMIAGVVVLVVVGVGFCLRAAHSERRIINAKSRIEMNAPNSTIEPTIDNSTIEQ